MKKSELRQIIREELQKLTNKSSKVLSEGMREDLAAQRDMMREYESSRTRRRDTIEEERKLARIYDVTVDADPNGDKFEQAVNKLVTRYKAMKEKPEINNGEMTFKMVRVEDEYQHSFDAEMANLFKKYKAGAKVKQKYIK